MVRIQQWQCERAGLDTAKIHRDKSEASTSYGGEHFATKWIDDRTNQIGGGQFDSGDLIVVPNPQIAESQLPQGRLGALDLAQLRRGHRLVVGNPRRQAWRSRLVGHRQTQVARDRTHCKLGHAGLGKRPQYAMFDGCARAWSVESSRIVRVFPVRNRVQLVVADDLILDSAEQLLFAVKATIRPVRLILRSITFMSRHLNERYADLACNLVRRTPFFGPQTGGDSQQRHDPLVAQCARCECEYYSGVDASGEGDSEPLDSLKTR